MKKTRRIVGIVAIIAMLACLVAGFAACVPLMEDEEEHVHALSKVDAVESTCTQQGNREYWTCKTCDKLFADDQGEQMLTADELSLGLKPHTLTEHPESDAACTEDGHLAYWTCSECNNVFEDDKGEHETTLDAVKIPAGHDWDEGTVTQDSTCTTPGVKTYTCSRDAGHTYEDPIAVDPTAHVLSKTDAKPATCTEDGNNDYWTCSECNNVFEDDKGEHETTLDEVTVKSEGHQYNGDHVCTVCYDVEEGFYAALTGEGTQEAPYIIETPDELNYIAFVEEDVFFQLKGEQTFYLTPVTTADGKIAHITFGDTDTTEPVAVQAPTTFRVFADGATYVIFSADYYAFFEAEDMLPLGYGVTADNTAEHASHNGNASGGNYMGGLTGGITLRGIEFTFISDSDASAVLAFGYAGATGNYSTQLNELFDFILNGEAITVEDGVTVLRNGYYSFARVEIATVQLQKGTNTLTLQVKGSVGGNVDYFSFVTKATVTSLNHFVFEAEDMNLSGSAVRAENIRASSGAYVDKISTNTYGGMELLFTSDRAAKATFYLSLSSAANTAVDLAAAATLTLNGETVDTTDVILPGYSSAWTYFRTTKVVALNLAEGHNALRLEHVYGVQFGNVDFFGLITEANLRAEFVFEAENLSRVGANIESPTSSYADSNSSGMTWVGGISTNVAASLTLFFDSDRAADVTLYLAFSGANNYDVAFNNAFTLTLNGEPVTPDESAHLYGGRAAYRYFHLNEIATFAVKEGMNTLVLTHVVGVQAGNIDYLSLATEANLTSNFYEAEGLELLGDANTDAQTAASGGAVAGNITTNHAGAGLRLTVISDRAASADLYVAFATSANRVVDIKAGFKLTINGTEVELGELSFTGQGWGVGILVNLATISLNAGENIIEITSTGQLGGNIDYIYLSSSAQLS